MRSHGASLVEINRLRPCYPITTLLIARNDSFLPRFLQSLHRKRAQARNPMRRRTLTPVEYAKAAELRMALRRFLRRSEIAARAHGLTPQRYQLLLQIKAANGEATVGSLCRDLQLGQSNVTQQVRRLERDGLVRRGLSAQDARVRHLRLTPEGDRRLARAVADLAEDREALISTIGADWAPSRRTRARSQKR